MREERSGPESFDGGHALHAFILTTFATTGRSPTMEDIRLQLGLESLRQAEEAVVALERAGAIHRNPGDDLITHAYPFSNEPTPHRVRLAGGPDVYSMCAIDALGMPFMLKRDGRIESACARCDAAVSVDIIGAEIASSDPAGIAVWMSEMQDGCVAATDLCPELNFFCSNAHLRAWSETHAETRGDGLTLPEALQRGRAIFERLLEP